MYDHLAVCRRLYDGFANRDPKVMMEVMTEDFSAQVSAGMPLGVGGAHQGRTAMFEEVWGPVFSAYEMNVEVETLLSCEDGSVVAIGNYRGVERSSEARVDARFAHILKLRDARVCSLEQITDTRAWDPGHTIA